MSKEDKIKWNKKHIDSKITPEPLKFITLYSKLSKGTQALDIACGLGRHSKYLASNGFTVDALDISDVAINSLKNIENINAQEVDFDTYQLINNRYDFIVCTYFLDRNIIHQIYDALTSTGIVIFETFIFHKDNERKTSNENFLLKEGELVEFFDNRYELLYIKEYWDEDYAGYKTMKGTVIAKKRALS